MRYKIIMETPVGKIGVAEENNAIVQLHFGSSGMEDIETKETSLLKSAKRELEEYFRGKRKTFDLPLSPAGTPFMKAVWEALCTVPYGETATYKQIAERIGNPKAVRAVGLANNRNPIAILIPCHRIIGCSGKLVGYAGGLDVKKSLLELEFGERCFEL